MIRETRTRIRPERDVDLKSRSLRELEEQLKETGDPVARAELIDALGADRRKGARELARKALRGEERARRQEARWRAFCDPECNVREKGFERVAGIDEAGRGPLAGPVVAAAVILPLEFVHHPLDDSKRMSPGARQSAYRAITDAAEAIGIGVATVEEIDRHNILGAVHVAVDRALSWLDPPADFALVDGRPLTSCAVPHQAIVGGDARSRVIAAASVIAKVTRDEMMLELDGRYPDYGFASHKGYATSFHLEALAEFGPSPAHRRSFMRKEEQLELSTEGGGESPQSWGRRAEELVAGQYRDMGYEILHRRWRGAGGELDLVCSRGSEIVVVEIKAARSETAGSPLGWLEAGQRRRIRRASAALMRELGTGGGKLVLRFDLVGIVDTCDGPPEMVRLEGIEP